MENVMGSGFLWIPLSPFLAGESGLLPSLLATMPVLSVSCSVLIEILVAPVAGPPLDALFAEAEPTI